MPTPPENHQDDDGQFESDRDDELPDIEYVKALAKVFTKHELDEIEIESGSARVLLRRADYASPPPVVAAAPAPVAAAPVAVVAPAPAAEAEVEGDYIESPFVGTFFRAPRPDAPNFVEVGSKVAQGKVVCIVEAMKLFNELEAEFDCQIEDVLVENGQPVEYGAKLFRVRKL